jgi:hypothetical protein
MADYQPLISRAVSGLTKNTGENRRALYERARTALVNQLRTVEPPLDESDITRERLALEEAIRKVEADASKRRPEGEATSISDTGLRGFRDTVSDAEGLGAAAAEANRSARGLHEAAMPGEPPPPPAESLPPHAASEPPLAEHYFEPSGQAAPAEDQAATAAPEYTVPPRTMPPPPPPLERDDEDVYSRPVRSWGRVVRLILLLLIVGALAAGGYYYRDTIMSTMASLRSAPAPKPRETAEPAGRPKIADRIGAENAPSSANAPAVAVAQKVVLYDEDPSDPKGKRYVGSALWRTETVSPGPGLAPELAVRADLDIPERHVRMTWSLRRNTDKALPASHTIEIVFTLPADFPEGGIGNIPGMLMKQDEQARGVPLAGLAVKVTNGYFLIGLSAVDVDVQRNIQLLKERDWFDIPIVYTSGKRAILAMEKGTPGVRAFQEAFRAWQQ